MDDESDPGDNRDDCFRPGHQQARRPLRDPLLYAQVAGRLQLGVWAGRARLAALRLHSLLFVWRTENPRLLYFEEQGRYKSEEVGQLEKPLYHA